MTSRPAAAALLGMLALGCHESARSAREDAQKAADDARAAVRDASREARAAVHEASREAREAAHDARGAVREAERDVRGAKQLLDVRAALAVSDEIGAVDGISVRTDEAGKVLYLDGVVETAADKAAAERIARDKADGLRVVNRLRVSPRR